jgi:hypothetical protein
MTLSSIRAYSHGSTMQFLFEICPDGKFRDYVNQLTILKGCMGFNFSCLVSSARTSVHLSRKSGQFSCPVCSSLDVSPPPGRRAAVEAYRKSLPTKQMCHRWISRQGKIQIKIPHRIILTWIIHEPSAANADHAQPQRLALSADPIRISIRQCPSARGNSLIWNTLHIFATKFVNNPG